MVVWIDGFEQYSAGSGDPVNLDSVYSVDTPTGFTMVAGRLGGSAIQFDTNIETSRYFQTPSLIATPTMVLGMAFYNPGSPANDRMLFGFYDGDGTLGMNVRLLTTNEFQVRRGTTVVASTSGAGTSGRWAYIEFKVVTHDTTGSYELRIDSVNVLSATNVDTKANAGTNSGFHASVRFNSAVSGGRIDDIWIDDSSFLGDKKVSTLYPDAAGSSADFTPSSGNGYQACDETTGHDGDSTYVESSTTGHRDSYGFPAPSGFGAIDAVQHNVVCRKTDATSFTLKPVCKSGSTTDVGSGQSVSSTTYTTKRRILTTDPDGSAWTASGIGGAEFGFEVG